MTPTSAEEICTLMQGLVARPKRPVGPDGIGPAERDFVTVEEPLEIHLDGDHLLTTMRTPGSDALLALGALFSEGLLESADEVESLVECGRPGMLRAVDVLPSQAGSVIENRLAFCRLGLATSACGVCGRGRLDDLLACCTRVESTDRIRPESVRRAVETLSFAQPIFRRTGGLHAAAAFDACGSPLAIYEDIGRHNAVDKVVGSLFRQRRLEHSTPPANRAALLAVSGRAGFELVQKAARARIPILASISAASSLAIDFAEALGVTLLSFVREGAFNVYTHPARLESDR